MPPKKSKPFTREDVIQCSYRKNPEVENVIRGLGVNSSLRKIFSSLTVSGDKFYDGVLQEFKSKVFDLARVLCNTMNNEKVPWYGGLTNDIRTWHKTNCKATGYSEKISQGLCLEVFITSCKSIRPKEASLRDYWNLARNGGVPPIFANPVEWDYPENEFIVYLCRNLQVAAGDKSFVLKHKSLADAVGCSQKFVNTQLEILELDGFIFRTFRGTKGRASEYRYIAKEVPDKFKSHRDIVNNLKRGKKYAT